MEFSNIGEFVVNNGLAVGITMYFLWKDSKLTKENTEILQQVKALLTTLLSKEGEK